MIKEPSKKDLFVFGTGFAAVLFLFSFAAWRKDAAAFPYLLGLGSILGLLALFVPETFRPLYRPWMRLAMLIAKVNTFIVSALLYFLVLTPYAVLSRLFGKDLLDEKLHTGESYWKDREPVTDPQAYERTF